MVVDTARIQHHLFAERPIDHTLHIHFALLGSPQTANLGPLHLLVLSYLSSIVRVAHEQAVAVLAYKVSIFICVGKRASALRTR